MDFNASKYKLSISKLTELNGGVNNYKSHALCIQKERLIRDLIAKDVLEAIM